MAVAWRLQRQSVADAPLLNPEDWRCIHTLAVAEITRVELAGLNLSQTAALRRIRELAAVAQGDGDDRDYMSRRYVELVRDDPGPTRPLDGAMPSRLPGRPARQGKRWAFDWINGEREVDA